MQSWDVSLSHRDQENRININYVAIDITPASSVWVPAITYKLTWLSCQEYGCKDCEIYINIYAWSNTYVYWIQKIGLVQLKVLENM